MDSTEDKGLGHIPIRRLAFVLVLVAVVAGMAFLWPNREESVRVVHADDPAATVPGVTLPKLPDPVDTNSFRSGWYLILAPKVFTTDDDLLLQAARELTIEARNAGYVDAQLIRPPVSGHSCNAEGVCASTGAPVGYFVLLKGPYVVPEWSDSDADRDAEFEWHQTTQAAEVAEATSRGLTVKPVIVVLEF